jgi:protein arginine kinase
MSGWYIEKGPESDVAVSSRVRLARNFKEYPFPSRMKREQAQQLMGKVKSSILDSNSDLANEVEYLDLSTLGSLDKYSLVEKHLISPELAVSKRDCSVILSRDESISIMINEEDHLRIQSIFPGMQINNAWKLCNKIDTLIEDSIEYAYSHSFGYLTCCPTNTGTGVRASVMLHLPVLSMTGHIRRILEACGKLGIAVRGIYGENSDTAGSMYQFSNQVTLGQSETDLINSVTNITSQIIEQERNLRNELHKQDSLRFEDRIFRSLGVFENARLITSEECMKLISDIRLGIVTELIKDISLEKLNEIMLLTQPANLQKHAGRILDSSECNAKRAELIKSILKK